MDQIPQRIRLHMPNAVLRSAGRSAKISYRWPVVQYHSKVIPMRPCLKFWMVLALLLRKF
jgi:hypothetical protein